MRHRLTSLFERWTQGERAPGLYAYGALAAPASLAYRLALMARPPLSRRFPALQHARLIVVSSPLVGGVGKTPLTALLANGLRSAGHRPAIVTMGYGRRSSGDACILEAAGGVLAESVGDEAAELWLATQCPVHVGQEPANAIDQLDRAIAHDWVIFDDGVSRAWQGEKRVVALSDSDFERPLRYLPFGRWRTTPASLKSASYVAITSLSDAPAANAHRERLQEWGFSGQVGWFSYRLEGMQPYPDGLSSDPPAGGPVRTGNPLVFCGIARPDRFCHSVRSLGLSDTAFRVFPDHHSYTRDDLAELERIRLRLGCTWFLTTLKDAVKIDPRWIGSTPLFFLRIALHQVAGTDILVALTKDG